MPVLLAALTTAVVGILAVLVVATGILSPVAPPTPTALLTDAERAWCHSIANAQAVDDQIFELFADAPANQPRLELIQRLPFTRIAGFEPGGHPSYQYKWIDRLAEFETRFPGDYARACRAAFTLRLAQ